MRTLLQLFLSFFKIGLFSFGGGLAMIPLIQEEVMFHQWLTQKEFVNMIAIAEITPAPIATNMATYVGFLNKGILGALVATLGVALPSFLILLILARYFLQFNKKPVVKSIMYGLRPTIVGLIAVAGLQIGAIGLINVEYFQQTKDLVGTFKVGGIFIAIIIGIGGYRFKIHPILLIILSGILGILIGGRL